MHSLVLEDVSLNINDIQIASKIEMRIQGLCALQMSSVACVPADFLLLFTKTHMYATNQINVEGSAYFDGKVLPACKIHYLLNQGIIFEAGYSVMNVLVMLNSQEADHIMDELGVTFPHKRVDHLSIQESKIFEIAVSLATEARIVFIRNFEVSSAVRETCLKALKKYASTREVVFLIETEYSRIFDSAVCISNTIVSLDRTDCEVFFRRLQLSAFNIQPMHERSTPNKIAIRATEAYNYRRLFMNYRTENLVDLKQKNISLLVRLFTYDFYRINMVHAFHVGFRRYEITLQKLEHRVSLARSIGPCILSILLARVLQEIRRGCWRDHLPIFLVYLLVFLTDPRREYAPLVLHFVKDMYVQECTAARVLSMIRNTFRGGYSALECRLISMPVSLCIFYQYSSILEEDFQALNYYMNIILTPGTYIMSIFVYMFFAHMITFSMLGCIFNINHMIVNVLCSFFTNLIYSPLLGARLRSSIIAFHLAILMADLHQSTKGDSLIYLFKLLGPVFPPTILIDLYRDIGVPLKSLHYLVFYCIMSYVICCCKISSK